MIIPDIEIRQLDYSNRNEVIEFCKVFWRVPVELGDEYVKDKSSDFIEEYAENIISTENENHNFNF